MPPSYHPNFKAFVGNQGLGYPKFNCVCWRSTGGRWERILHKDVNLGPHVFTLEQKALPEATADDSHVIFHKDNN